jgi:hypothetical protein
MYANQTDFEAWMQKQLPALCAPPYPLRFASIYTDNGGTLQLNQHTADAVAAWPAVDKRCLLDDRSTDTLTPQQYGSTVDFAANRPFPSLACRFAVGLMFKRSALTHDQVPQYYFQQLLQTLPPPLSRPALRSAA